MTSTPRLDSLTTDGSDFNGIRLADGHLLTLKICPGAAVAQEVFLYPGLAAPDAEGWGNKDDLEEWLTGGTFRGGSLYGDVPIEAVRDLVVQHGGEHENQEPPAPSMEAAEDLRRPDPLGDIAHLHGRFADGYSARDIRSVFGRIYDEGGPYLVCVWEYADENGFGGTSTFFAEEEDGSLFEVRADIHRWLSGQQETPGPMATWVCAPVEPTEFVVSDDFHNYARVDRVE
ncbi:hypothetical protein [Streptomyces sp. NRRL S-87]|uniref:hypothetical protein n=1 Tax=Streptomyces sp. NRRL S-87 TaxID=1463920 RepID=UPI0004C156AA|nr:hypothetical protein [Streptomyces sp. NRRL S-87]